MAVLGPPAESADEDGYLWPCNVETWAYWQAVQTQWRVVQGAGETGLDYAGVRAYLAESIRKRGKRRHIFDGIRAAERGHLEGRGIAAQRRKK